MSTFTTPLEYQPTGKTRRGRPVYQLTYGFSYRVGSEQSKCYVFAEAGFETDFASIPRPLRRFFPPDGPWAKAAVIHDALYEEPKFSRWMADRIFFEAMGVLGVRLSTRLAMYAAVRLIGWRSFGQRHAE